VRGLSLRARLMSPRVVLWAKTAVPPPIRHLLRRTVNSATLLQAAPRPGLSIEERLELLGSFRADIELVSEFLKRDMWALWSRGTQNAESADH
jgi:hypothetical protein